MGLEVRGGSDVAYPKASQLAEIGDGTGNDFQSDNLELPSWEPKRGAVIWRRCHQSVD